MKNLGFTVGVIGLFALSACGGKSEGTVAAQACVALASCQLSQLALPECSFDIHLISQDSTALALHATAAQVECVASAGSNCDNVRKCLNGGQTPSVCTGGSSCDGKTIVLCDDNLSAPGTKGTRRFDCSSIGLDCVANNGTIECGVGTCSGLSASCTGDKISYCSASGISSEYDCGEGGATCNASGLPHCRGAGATCTQSTGNPYNLPPIRCDGSKLVYCADGQESSHDCAAFGLGCFPNLHGQAFTCALAGECDTSYGATCSTDGKLTFCNGGKVDKLDCKGQGYASCSPDNGGRCIK